MSRDSNRQKRRELGLDKQEAKRISRDQQRQDWERGLEHDKHQAKRMSRDYK